MWAIFICLSTAIISLEMIQQRLYVETVPTLIIVGLFSTAAAFYIYHYENRIVTNPARTAALLGLFIFLLGISKIGMLLTQMSAWATGTAIITAIILTIAYDQRFAMGMSVFYCLLAGFTVRQPSDINLFLTMMAGTFTCCSGLKEIRTRMKLLEISALAACNSSSYGGFIELFIQNFPACGGFQKRRLCMRWRHLSAGFLFKVCCRSSKRYSA